MHETGGPAAWRGAEIAALDDWRFELAPTDLAALAEAVRALAAPVRSGARRLTDIDPGEVGVAAVSRLAERIRQELLDGRGFALVHGLPVDDLDPVENQVMYWALASQVAVPMRQNDAGDVLTRVRDEGRDFNQLVVRAYQTNANLDYHTDSSDIVALYCLRPAKQGGTSTIVSSVAVHDELVRRRPDLAALLHDPWPQISPLDGAVTFPPICVTNAGGRLFTRYGRKYTELAAEQRPDLVAPLSVGQLAALDAFDAITREPGFVLNMDFRPGDVQFLNNYVVMHARTEYVDWPEEHRRRELLRMWLVCRPADDATLDLPEVFADAGFISRAVARAGRAETSGFPVP